jgi:hypothetical protein
MLFATSYLFFTIFKTPCKFYLTNIFKANYLISSVICILLGGFLIALLVLYIGLTTEDVFIEDAEFDH